MTLRSVLFWLHLAAGLLCGLFIGVMCFTGAVLSFEKELVAWWERDARQVATVGTTRLPLADLQARLREARPDFRPANVILQNDSRATVAFSAGRTGGYYVDPYTGAVLAPASDAMAAFMREMTAWHRTLGLRDETLRPHGKLINGVANIAFCALALTGLYLWIPRAWSWRAVRPVIWFRRNATSKARDFNWHNAIGLWTAPVLIVLTLTAIPISFQWGGRLISTLTGTPTAGPGGGATGNGRAVEIPAPPAGTVILSHDALLAVVQEQMPAWTSITLRLANAPAGRGGDVAREPRSAMPPAATFTVRESGTWPRTAATTLSLNPYTGAILRRSGYSDLNAAQQVRSWTRFLHTGEALGPAGQLVAGLACVGGLFLVYTGVALSWRRFFGRTARPASGNGGAPEPLTRLEPCDASAGTHTGPRPFRDETPR